MYLTARGGGDISQCFAEEYRSLAATHAHATTEISRPLIRPCMKLYACAKGKARVPVTKIKILKSIQKITIIIRLFYVHYLRDTSVRQVIMLLTFVVTYTIIFLF